MYYLELLRILGKLLGFFFFSDKSLPLCVTRRMSLMPRRDSYISEGPCFGDDLIFLFKTSYYGLNDSIMLKNTKDAKVSLKMVQLWTNFAKGIL